MTILFLTTRQFSQPSWRNRDQTLQALDFIFSYHKIFPEALLKSILPYPYNRIHPRPNRKEDP